jgi:formate hydrogenlyase transcriptional activator
MGNKSREQADEEAAKLRSQAEERLKSEADSLQKARTLDDTQRIIHELEVHQIELEMQNEELSQSQAELELSRNMYAELFDFAPVGYFSFDTDGVMREINLSAASLLGKSRRMLINKPFSAYIADTAGRQLFSEHLAAVIEKHEMQKCEIRLMGKDGTVIHGELQSVVMEPADTGDRFILSSLVDGTIAGLRKECMQDAHNNLEDIVTERTKNLVRSNLLLTQEIEERKKAENSLQAAYQEIKQLKNRLQAENSYLQAEVAKHNNFGEIIGQSAAITQLFSQVEKVAPMNATVLLLGETGTGKGVVARAIHSNGSRKERAMTTVNCAALPANLIESELFGREKGAFTGAHTRQIGRFELADGGTIFLDEIGEMPLDLQCKLLRVIQDGEFERVGSPRTITVDVRIIAASNRNLEQEIRNGTFREDLYYRLNVFPITIPPLRQRKEDISLLVNHFVAKFNKKIGKKIANIPKETLNLLQEHCWPGNVRELESVIERAVITSQGTTLQILDRFDTFERMPETGQEVKALVDLEHDHILMMLQKTGWRIEGKSGAAILLGINPSTLRARMRKYGIARQ